MSSANGTPRPMSSSSWRWNAPWLRSPVRASCSAWVTTAPWASALRRAMDAWPANSCTSSNSSRVKWDSSPPIRAMLSVPMTSPADEERAHDHRLRLLRRARDLHRPGVEVRIVGQHRLAVADRPAGDACVQRALVREDHVREPVAGNDRLADPGVAVHPVDRERVVGDHRLERVRDHLQHAAGVERGEEPLVHLQEAALALQPMAKLLLLPTDLAEGLGVDERLCRVAGEDLQDPLVVLGVLVVAPLGQDDDPQHTLLVGHRHEEHGLRPAAPAHLDPTPVRGHVAQPDRGVAERDPPGEPLADPHPQTVEGRRPDILELALERDGLAGLRDVVNSVDTDRVVADELVRLGHDRLADALDLLDPVEARGQLLDRSQTGRALAHRLEQAGIGDGDRPSGWRTSSTAPVHPASSRRSSGGTGRGGPAPRHGTRAGRSSPSGSPAWRTGRRTWGRIRGDRGRCCGALRSPADRRSGRPGSPSRLLRQPPGRGRGGQPAAWDGARDRGARGLPRRRRTSIARRPGRRRRPRPAQGWR